MRSLLASAVLLTFAASCSDSEAERQVAAPAPPEKSSALPAAASPDAQTGAQTGAQAAEKSAEKPAEQPAEKPAEEPPFAKVDGPRGLRTRKEGALDGVTLIAPLNSKQTHLVDLDGKVVHTWTCDHVPAGATYFLENGHLLRTAMLENNPRFHGGGIGGRIEERSWSGELLWEYELANDQRTTHHDIALLPNGNVLAIAYEYHAPEEAFEHGLAVEQIDDKDGHWCDVVIEIEPTRPKGGKIVWEWRSFDHLVQDLDPEQKGYGKPADFPGRIDINCHHRFDRVESDEERLEREERERQIQALGYTGGKAAVADEEKKKADGAPKKRKHGADWLHLNTVGYLAELDLIVLSTPDLSEIWVIDHSTTTAEAASDRGGRWGRGGELLYRFGNPRNYGCGKAEDRSLWYQHQPSWQRGETPGELALLFFNNGSGRPGKEHSSIEEVLLPFTPEKGFAKEAGKAFPAPKELWRYADPEKLFSPFISGAQRLSNGNTLICEGARGRVLEVTRAGEIVWDYYNPLGGDVEPKEQQGKAPPHALFRATRLPKGHPGLAGRL
ncbi:MAG: aryl-sulfate sulfotransferase [Planctomycetes bacterium]|nr:aryl-sulfate sulfotransferase [Planctomycetota bacterium]